MMKATVKELRDFINDCKSEFETELHFTIDEMTFTHDCAHVFENNYYDRPDGSSILVGSRVISFGLQKHMIDAFARPFSCDVKTIEINNITIYYCEY